MAVSAAVCAEFDEDRLAADGQSPPWLVFEWYAVEGLVGDADKSQFRGVPGSLKAQKARQDQVPLSAKRYLKTPSIFGFHGVYRLLARTLGIERDGQLAATGEELLDVWSKERGLPGFVARAPGLVSPRDVCWSRPSKLVSRLGTLIALRRGMDGVSFASI